MSEAATHVGTGKVRELYALDDERLLLVASDRISTFDVVLPTDIPDKGRVLTGLSAFWFARTRDLVPNHLLAAPRGRPLDGVPAARDAPDRVRRPRLPRRLGLEGLPRDRRGLRASAAGGLAESQQLPEPIFTPATKAQTGHDENITRDEAAELVGAELFAEAERISLALYRFGAEYAAARGIILADTKFELGLDRTGRSCSATRRSRPTRRGSGRPTATRPAGRSRRSTSSSCATTASRSAGTRRRPGPSFPTRSSPGTRARYVEAFERLTGIAFDDYVADPEVVAR